MWRWPVVAKKRDLWNAAKQKNYTIHAKLISIAAEKWWDPHTNPSLYDAIEKARKDNLPNENILRAIKKWTWDDKDASKIEKIVYEWYWTWWVWIIISTLTDNKNRTAADIRHIFGRYWWTMWEPGSMSFMFEKKWILIIDLDKYSKDFLEEIIFETDWEDFFEEDGMFKIITSLENFNKTKNILNEKKIETYFADIDYLPNNMIEISDFDKALKLTKMIEDFKENEDVEKISVNLEISKKLQKEVDDFIEKNTFKT